VEAAQPEKMSCFGSAARGTMGPDSDLTCWSSREASSNRWRLLTRIYQRLRGKDGPLNVVVVTPEEVERYRDTHCLVISPALKEGKVVYEKEAPAADDPREMAQSSAQQLARARSAHPEAYLEDLGFDAQQPLKGHQERFRSPARASPLYSRPRITAWDLNGAGLKIPKYVYCRRMHSLLTLL